MLKHFFKIDFTGLPRPIFMTLTYPDERATPDLAKRNMHRAHMARRLEAHTGKHVMAAWRVEWMPRLSGSLIDHVCPHWHWLILGHEFIHRDEVNRMWKETIDWDGYCRTETKGVEKGEVVPLYMAKYISKEAVNPSLVNAAYHTKIGRAYGWLRKKEIPLATQHHYRHLSGEQIAALTALAEEQLPWYSACHQQSFTTLGEVSQDFRRIIDGEALDE